MAFKEFATLGINDQSSTKIRKINAELKKLFQTANKLKSKKIDFGINAKGIDKASAALRRLNADANKLGSKKVNLGINTAGLTKAQTQMRAFSREAAKLGSRPVNLRINSTGLSQIESQARRTRAMLERPIRMNISGNVPNVPRGFGGINNGGRNTNPSGYSFVARGASQFGTGLLAGGMRLGVVGITAASVAAIGAAVGSAIGRGIMAADASNLMFAASATPAQEKILREAAKNAPKGTIFSTAEREQQMISLLGDVSGNTPEERARNAAIVQQQVFEPMSQKLFALKGGDKQQTADGLALLWKGVNLASQVAIENGKITKDAQRVINADMAAMSVDPQLKPQTLLSGKRGLKTSAYALDEAGMIRFNLNLGARGQRGGNETFQVVEAFQGNQDAQANEFLYQRGFLKDVVRNKKGKIIEATATDSQFVSENPFAFLAGPVRQDIEKYWREKGELAEGEAPSVTQVVDYLRKATGRNTSRQGAADMILGDEAFIAQEAQAADIAGNNQRIFDASEQSLSKRFVDTSNTLNDLGGELLKYFPSSMEQGFTATGADKTFGALSNPSKALNNLADFLSNVGSTILGTIIPAAQAATALNQVAASAAATAAANNAFVRVANFNTNKMTAAQRKEAALRQFQREQGLEETGKRNKRTRERERALFKPGAADMGGKDKVREFQKKFGLKVDGLFGAESKKALDDYKAQLILYGAGRVPPPIEPPKPPAVNPYTGRTGGGQLTDATLGGPLNAIVDQNVASLTQFNTAVDNTAAAVAAAGRRFDAAMAWLRSTPNKIPTNGSGTGEGGMFSGNPGSTTTTTGDSFAGVPTPDLQFSIDAFVTKITSAGDAAAQFASSALSWLSTRPEPNTIPPNGSGTGPGGMFGGTPGSTTDMTTDGFGGVKFPVPMPVTFARTGLEGVSMGRPDAPIPGGGGLSTIDQMLAGMDRAAGNAVAASNQIDTAASGAVSTLSGAAPGIGAAIGDAAVAKINSANVNVTVNATTNSGRVGTGDTGRTRVGREGGPD